ncbi:MAG: hypothetical protein H6R21_2462 [Proteobacteria bacterium]|nr:hypothetical protein [Pseudomonadota bacterium]
MNATRQPTPASRPLIGLALGGGSARGWAHIGVIRALADAGIEPDIVCGIGFFRSHFVDRDIRELARPFGVVATDLQRGREVWLREGPVTAAVHASIALPGLFTPVQRDGRWLVDGGLVNPVPVSLCRAMGADVVIAVDLNADLLGRHLKPRPARAKPRRAPAAPETLTDAMMARIQTGMSQLGINHRDEPAPPAMLDVLASSINIMQVLITRSRLAGEPADVLVTPLLAELELMAFHRADVAIDAGRRAVEAALPQLRVRLDGANDG